MTPTQNGENVALPPYDETMVRLSKLLCFTRGDQLMMRQEHSPPALSQPDIDLRVLVLIHLALRPQDETIPILAWRFSLLSQRRAQKDRVQ